MPHIISLLLLSFIAATVLAADPPEVAPGAYSSYNCQITAVQEGKLTVHSLRGPSGIVKDVPLDPKVEIFLLDGSPGKLADLKAEQWIKLHWKYDDNKKEVAIRIDFRKPPF